VKHPRRRAAFAVATLLLAALLASFWHFRSREAKSIASAGSAASPFVKSGKRPPARDFKRRVGYSLTPRAEKRTPTR